LRVRIAAQRLEDDEALFETIMAELASSKSNVKVQVVARMLGLQNVLDTPVGNEMSRGVSGGERKRVTTAEILAGPKVCGQPVALPFV
jgi:ABC-type multidrug transport system ATPase subunit